VKTFFRLTTLALSQPNQRAEFPFDRQAQIY